VSLNDSLADHASTDASNTIEQWALAYLRSPSLDARRKVSPPPKEFSASPVAHREARPTRPPPLRVVDRAVKVASHPEALRSVEKRAALLHSFAHHELQAAELFAWAIVAWPDAPTPFRRGLVHIMLDEVHHLDLYLSRIEALGFAWGDWEVRDWFWQRIASAKSPAHFVATMGLGFEGANLDHGARFSTLLDRAGDPESAALVRIVTEQERSHVAFAAHWFERFTGTIEPSAWRAHLVEPLSPLVMRGPTIDRAARMRASMPKALIDAIAAYDPKTDRTRALP
jgi:uncharacterized ferritin-like protein (DUF455 family)